MPRLIDAEELIEVAHRERLDSRERIERMIESAPTIDAEPVRHGYWEWDGDFICSNCGERGHRNKWNYCPNCGAKMDEVCE